MANRAYLYSMNKVPEKGPATPGIKITGLNEYNWEIPLAFLILVSEDTKICKSLIYEGENSGILGDYAKGVQQLQKLLELIRENGVQFPEIYDTKCRETLEFLNDEKNKQKYIFLELGEIFAINGEIADQPEKFLTEIKYVRRLLDNNEFESLNTYMVDDVRTHWESSLGIGYWSNILYFDFSPQESDNK